MNTNNFPEYHHEFPRQPRQTQNPRRQWARQAPGILSHTGQLRYDRMRNMARPTHHCRPASLNIRVHRRDSRRQHARSLVERATSATLPDTTRARSAHDACTPWALSETNKHYATPRSWLLLAYATAAQHSTTALHRRGLPCPAPNRSL